MTNATAMLPLSAELERVGMYTVRHAPDMDRPYRLHEDRAHAGTVRGRTQCVDSFLSESAARHAARLLHSGGCVLDVAAPIGARVIPRRAR